MTGRSTSVGVLAYTLADGAVLVAPAVVLAAEAAQAAVPLPHGLDLVIGSVVLALVHGAVVWRWFASMRAGASPHRTVSIHIASLNALVVLALAATGLLIAVLAGFADVHIVLAVAGWPVVALWVGVEVIAVVLAELVRRHLFAWLEAGRDQTAPASMDRRGASEAWRGAGSATPATETRTGAG